MITKDDVEWCYRHFLGREPESIEVINNHIAAIPTFRELVINFLNSQEFFHRKAAPTFMPLDNPKMHVEYTANPSEIELLKKRVRQAWTHMGAVRPYHSVLTNPIFLEQNINEAAIKQFWMSGEREAEGIWRILNRYGFVDFHSKDCIEYGCGMGRVTLPLAKIFSKVTAYDISSTHLSFAKGRALDGGYRNIDFHLCDDKLNAEYGGCDFFYSRIVFQHNPPPLMRELVYLMLQSLRPKGIAIFQLPTYALDYRFSLDEYLANQGPLDMEMHCLPQEEVFRISAEAGCSVLEVREDGCVGRVGQWISNTFIVRRNKSPTSSKNQL
jgi:SAM-dependent methyltransferase